MELVEPSIQYRDSFLKAVEEYKNASLNEVTQLNRAYNIEQWVNNFEEYVKKTQSESIGQNLPEGYVPQTTYWLIDKGEFIGRVSIRHYLNEHLLKEGGHIGYDIRPSKRKMGYGKKILALALKKAKVLGIDNVLVTCDKTNTASKKIIEANGGILENNSIQSDETFVKLRYWINCDTC